MKLRMGTKLRNVTYREAVQLLRMSERLLDAPVTPAAKSWFALRGLTLRRFLADGAAVLHAEEEESRAYCHSCERAGVDPGDDEYEHLRDVRDLLADIEAVL